MREKSGRREWRHPNNLCPCLLYFSCTDAEKKQTGRSKSPECIHHIAPWITWARCSWRSQTSATSRASNLLRFNWARGRGKVCGNHFGIRSQGKGDGVVSKCVQKYLSDYCWNMNPLCFCTFSVCVGSDLKFCNIASSLTLRLLHLLLVFHLF